MNGDDFLEVLQADVLAILQNVPSLAAVNLIKEDDGDMEAMILRKLGHLTEGSTAKLGAVAVVMLPEVSDAEENLPGPPLDVALKVQFIEQHIINRDATKGSGVRSSEGALRVLAALHHQQIGSHVLFARPKNPVEPVEVKKGFLSHMVFLRLNFNGLTGPGKVAAVHATEADDIITLACATAGAAIYYTTDGSYPTPESGTLYSAPITDATVGDTWRVAAYKTGLNPSDCLEFLIAVPAGAITDGDFILTDADGSVLTDP